MIFFLPTQFSRSSSPPPRLPPLFRSFRTNPLFFYYLGFPFPRRFSHPKRLFSNLAAAPRALQTSTALLRWTVRSIPPMALGPLLSTPQSPVSIQINLSLCSPFPVGNALLPRKRWIDVFEYPSPVPLHDKTPVFKPGLSGSLFPPENRIHAR